ncbi:AAA-like domain protein [Variibacter gotjawalensis]|uniref:AAA-like domain protein n=1 Tax=Variibacter gotjawalensis TaxID=1333996 RepID=A0A0S3PVI1_9BRAD|nr:ATP-binding protein [Variibacter gotjawalensis]NIK45782.1 hypothetical protein [Variibacter gotjawalensis]RZS47706.1 hypothetical protein EV661_0099 [Variibacter gotjawalensis]BAT59959.1 AAA-like domain protein [Variibacter gotjawalensis]
MFVNEQGEAVGRILSVKGAIATVALPEGNLAKEMEGPATVGKFLSVHTRDAHLIALVSYVRREDPNLARAFGHYSVAEVDMMGQFIDDNGEMKFRRGVTHYPTIGDAVSLVTRDQLRVIYAVNGPNMIEIGKLQQDTAVSACVNIQDMVGKHFAILGTTGVGKSTSVALILDLILQTRPDLRIFLLDTHNEYARCFKGRAFSITPRNLKLPFWLFNFEEFVDVIYGGRPGPDEGVDVLGELIPQAKAAYAQQKTGLRRADTRNSGYTVDTPVPYRLADLVQMIDDQMGKLENRTSRMKFNRLISRIETVRNDPRYQFMFENANVGGDTMAETLMQLFRLPPDGMPMTIMQLAGFPPEVIDAVVSVMGRMAFDFGLWSDGAAPVLFVCEEAHRYASADKATGFGPTRKALSRIAKEGRKYGVYLGLITQRPAELDPTILSQCNTLFAMRLSNERDQAFLRAAVSDAGANLLDYVPSLGTAEVLAFGEGVALPTRLKFNHLPEHKRPAGEADANSKVDMNGSLPIDFLNAVIERWRGIGNSQSSQRSGARMDDGSAVEDPAETFEMVRQEFSSLPTGYQGSPLPASPPLVPSNAPSLGDPGRFSVRKPLPAHGDPSEAQRFQQPQPPAPPPPSGQPQTGAGARAAFSRFIPTKR